jgi:pyridoxamine 5'-phosphate oxidase
MTLLNCHDLRREYGELSLQLQDITIEPLQQFVRWYQDAVAAGNQEPHAMVLATVDATLQPDARVVLLKEVDESGFIFYTHYDSPKAQQLNNNPLAALTFYWPELTRQVRVHGYAKRITTARSAAYFASRSRDSQLAVYASPQSTTILEGTLVQKLEEVRHHFEGKSIPCPPNWGGFCIYPTVIEFFQGRNGRLHDRIRYSLREDAWIVEKLAP